MGVHTSISRTVVVTYCDAQYIDHNNSIHRDTIKLYGNYDIDSAHGAVRRKMHAKGCIIHSVSHVSFYGKMSLEQFAKHCEKTDIKEW